MKPVLAGVDAAGAGFSAGSAAASCPGFLWGRVTIFSLTCSGSFWAMTLAFRATWACFLPTETPRRKMTTPMTKMPKKMMASWELEGLRFLGDDLSRFGQLAGGLKFALGMDDLGPALSFSFGLLGDRPDHRFRKVHVFRFYELDLDPPGVGVLIQDLLQLGVQFLPLGEEVVEFDLAQHAAQGRLRQLGWGIEIVLNVDDRFEGLYDSEVDDSIDFYRYVF